MSNHPVIAKAKPAGRCPMHASVELSPTGCPISSSAARFDPFEGPYQVNPADALRWSRDQEPVFYSPKLGYWVVSRYEDVKAVFRDNQTFSPSIALEKITPMTQEAQDILRRYDFGLNRTLVNEDEPAHMERRRALMHSFTPAQLAHHEPMVRRLTREAVDRIIDRGEADLVAEMLHEVPLTVALHFLGVPEEAMAKMKEYSVAHTLNTWGRPTPEEQLKVAETVGRFWQYTGEVLEQMRKNPDGHGWMHYSICRQQELPEVITDSYLHSMMMAGLVAAHETTVFASTNMLRLLLEQREVWEEICENPALIPNAVEECLRLAGSIVAWRRLATRDTEVGGVSIPAGSKLLIVMTSANHDERHFDNPDELDIYRANTTDHLTFGYGSHQCMGKNLARMEMRIFLEELTRRLPHLELVEQEFTFVPNTSFRGPEQLWVRWDPARNPERHDSSIRERVREFTIGAPSKHDAARAVRVVEVRREAEDVLGLVLEDPRGRALPRWTPGAHVDLVVGEYVRMYSLCGDPEDSGRLQVAILKEPAGRGGSAYIHENLKVGDLIRLRGPKNHFRLDEEAEEYLLIAGGIGITPILAMADRLKKLGKRYSLHYCGRSRRSMAFLQRLERDHGQHLRLYPGDEGRRLDLGVVLTAHADARIYSCGPERLLAALEELTADRPDALHVEHFTTAGNLLDPDKEIGFEVELSDSELTVQVPPDQTVLQALRAVGVDIQSDCEEGLCGSCEVPVVEGDIEHRDKVLTAQERAESKRMMTCCSRARRGKIVLGL